MTPQDYQDDPRLTAYVLGELTQSEREQVESLLSDQEGARRAVEEIRATAELLKRELQTEKGAPGLTADQRQAVAEHARTPRLATQMSYVLQIAVALAACVVLVGVLLPTLSKARSRSQTVSAPSQRGQQGMPNDRKGQRSTIDGFTLTDPATKGPAAVNPQAQAAGQ